MVVWHELCFSYYMMHKPAGIMSQRNEPNGESVYDLFDQLAAAGLIPGPPPPPRVGAIGRLDRDTSGLMVLSDDRRFCGALSQVRNCSKHYEATVCGIWKDADAPVEMLRQPYRYQRKETAGGREVWTGPAIVRVLRTWLEEVPAGCPAFLGGRSVLEFELYEGRHRQIRRLCSRSKLRLLSLHRTAVGPLHLRHLPVGSVRPLLENELMELQELCGLTLLDETPSPA